MRSYSTIFVGILIIIIFPGCATLSKKECEQGDWSAIGYRDGAIGARTGLLQNHKDACAKHHIKIDDTAYYQGRMRGLEQVFCQPRNAYQIGMRGTSHGNVCPSHMQREFNKAYQYGNQIHTFQIKANEQQNIIDSLKTEYQALSHQSEQIRVQLRHYPRKPLFERIKQHLHHEFEDQLELWDDTFEEIEKRKKLDRKQKSVLESVASNAASKGKLQNRINWIREKGSDRFSIRSMTRIRERIERIDSKILQQIRTLGPAFQGQVHRAKLDDLILNAGYAGMLESQIKILKQLRDDQQVKMFIQFHYRHELQANPHMDKSLLQDVKLRSKRQLRQALREIRSKQVELDQQIADNENLLQRRLNEIDQLKQNSPYR